jgi:succinyl-CoA synthetase beta subunit
MLNNEITRIVKKAADTGWVLEPEAKKIFSLAGLPVPDFTFAGTADEAVDFASRAGYPVVAKVVSPEILHKSDVGGVEVGISDETGLRSAFKKFSAMDGFRGMLVEEMVKGTELIIGATVDPQFGPVVLLGIGGVGVELYKDSAIRMAPLNGHDVEMMISSLKARKIIEGFRGGKPINVEKLTAMMIDFSNLVMELERKIQSIDLNPVMCTPERCVIADARIILSEWAVIGIDKENPEE